MLKPQHAERLLVLLGERGSKDGAAVRRGDVAIPALNAVKLEPGASVTVAQYNQLVDDLATLRAAFSALAGR